MRKICTVWVILLYLGASTCNDVPCAKRQTEFGWVCVCNATYCDTVERPQPLPVGHYYHYTTSENNPGFHRTTGTFKKILPATVEANATVMFTINHNIQYQEVLGFGGSFTDSAGMAVNSLPSETQAKLIESYFGPNGLEYSMGRVPLGASDFSSRIYFYDDVPNDDEMVNFTLVDEDYKYKIPLIQKAMKASPHNFKLIACAFSSPSWMKTNNDIGAGFIKRAHYHAWAKYHVKFLDAYANHSIPFWALTGGNEVFTFLMFQGLLPIGLVAMPHDHRIWVRDHLTRQLAASNHSEVKFFILDDQRPFTNAWLSRFALDPVAYKQIAGVALHWYFDWFTNVSLAENIHQTYPDKPLIYTESSANNILFGGRAVELGSWSRAALYAYNIIENLDHWTTAYLDWNLALNTEGGPYLLMALDAPIIVNATGKEFYKNPMFYALGHFSKFILPGSRRVDVISHQPVSPDVLRDFNQVILARFAHRRFVKGTPLAEEDATTTVRTEVTTFPFPIPIIAPKTVSCLATVHSDNSSTVIIYNGMDSDVNVIIVDTVSGYLTASVTANSINTFVYWFKK